MLMIALDALGQFFIAGAGVIAQTMIGNYVSTVVGGMARVLGTLAGGLFGWVKSLITGVVSTPLFSMPEEMMAA